MKRTPSAGIYDRRLRGWGASGATPGVSTGLEAPAPAAQATHAGPPDAPFVVRTKLSVPAIPPLHVERTRLLEALDGCMTAPLTLVSGGPGSGKSVLAASWAASSRPPSPVAWLSLDAGDDRSRVHFWRLVLLALAEAGVDIGADLVDGSSQAAIDRILAALVGRLSDPAHGAVLVLDDFGLVESREILEDVYRLVTAAPAGLRIVATVRGAPTMRLPRLRLEQLVAEIDAELLAFTPEEMTRMLEGTGIALDPTVQEQLWDATEGWAAGLRLATLALRAHADPVAFVNGFSGHEATVSAYLVEEVLSAEPEETTRFLLETSVLDAVCGELADAATGGHGGGALLAELSQRGALMTALDDHGEWYRYHGLLLEALRGRAELLMPERLPGIHVRAARWLADHEMGPAAALEAIRAGDLDLLADIVVRHGIPMIAQGDLGDLATVLLEEIPLPDLHLEPVLLLALAGAASERGDVDETMLWLDRAERVVDLLRPQHRAMYDAGRTLFRLQISRMRGAIDDTLAAGELLVQSGPGGTLDHLGNAGDIRVVALLTLGSLEMWLVDAAMGKRTLTAGLAAARERQRPYLTVYGLGHLAVCEALLGDMTASERAAEEALAIADRSGLRNTPRVAAALLALGSVAGARSDLETAAEYYDAVEQTIEDWHDEPLRAYVDFGRAALLSMQGRLDEAIALLETVHIGDPDAQMRTSVDEAVLALRAALRAAAGDRPAAIAELRELLPNAVRGEVPVVLASLLVDAGEPEEALALATPWTDTGLETIRWGIYQARAWLVVSTAHLALGDQQAAARALEGALACAAPERLSRPFVYASPELHARLQQYVAAGGAHAEFAQEILTRVAERPAPTGAPGTLPVATTALSERELAVLQFLPGTLTNAEIADTLYVSINTVKTHVKSIYTKLGATDRRTAVAAARALGLLETTPRP